MLTLQLIQISVLIISPHFTWRKPQLVNFQVYGTYRFWGCFQCDISKLKFYFSVILCLKLDQTPLVKTFYCVFKKEFFKHFQKKFYFSIFLSLKKLQNSVFSNFWSLQFCLLQDVKLLSFFSLFLSSNFIFH